MKKSNFDKLIKRYVTKKTSERETIKIEVMLNAIKKRGIRFMSEETEELLFLKIKDDEIEASEINFFINELCKLRVAEIQWMKFKGMDVYFAKQAY